MKKITVVLALLLLPLIGGSCTDMEFHFCTGGGVNAARLTGDDLFRTSWMYDVDVSLLNFTFGGKHTIGMPFVYKYYSETIFTDYKFQLESHRDFGLGLSYRYSFNDRIGLLGQVACYYRNYSRNHGSLFGMDLSVELWLMPIEYIGLRIPFTMGFTRDEIDFSIGLGAVVNISKEDI